MNSAHRSAGTTTTYFPTTVVVGFDGSVLSRSAATVAADIAAKSGSPLRLVRVLTEGQSGGYAEATARRELREFTSGLSASHRQHIVEDIRVGDSAVELTADAHELSAGLIVLGTSHHTGFAKALLGSTVEAVLRLTTCPVLITSGAPGSWPPRHVVIGDDATSESRLAGLVAAELAALFGAETTLLEAIPVDARAEATGADWLGRVREIFEDRLRDRAGELAAAQRPPPAVSVAAGDAASALLAAVQGAHGNHTLVAMGTHRRAGLAHLFHSSVALGVMDKVTGPVLISPVGTDR
jgi:nucleotide-binding universal stress UspA family protein